MTFRRLAFNNIRGNWHQYGAFFWSSVFSVMIFFIYSAFLYHPDVVNGTMQAADKVKKALGACQVIIIVFSFFFILYSITAFIRARKKEFGLFSLFGMTSGQLKRMVFYENMIVSVASITVGIGFGILFSKLFFMMLAEIMRMENPIRFMVPMKAVTITAVGFLSLFLIITVYSLIKVGRTEIIDLIRSSRQPKTLPLYSKWLVALTVICLGSCYFLAYTMTARTFVVYFMPIIILVMIGTYFLFTQSSVAIFRRLQKNKSFFYNRTNLIIIGQLMFKVKDNARVLFMVSILSAVILTASGTVYIFDTQMKEQFMGNFPQTITYMEKGLNAHVVINREKMNQILAEDGFEKEYEYAVPGIPTAEITSTGPMRKNDRLLVVAERDYNDAAKKANKPAVQVARNHAFFIVPYESIERELYKPGQQTDMRIASLPPMKLTIDGQMNKSPFSYQFYYGYMYVLNDAQFKELADQVGESSQVVLYGLEIKNWERMYSTAEKIKKLVPEEKKYQFLSRTKMFMDSDQSNSLALFIGIFISVLFFIATGSIIYFKLFTEVEEDRQQFRALARIGMTDQEIRKVVTAQVGLIFYLPCLVGIVHLSFAMKALGNILNINVAMYAAIVCVIFLIMQTGYFLTARRTYMRFILRESIA